MKRLALAGLVGLLLWMVPCTVHAQGQNSSAPTSNQVTIWPGPGKPQAATAAPEANRTGQTAGAHPSSAADLLALQNELTGEMQSLQQQMGQAQNPNEVQRVQKQVEILQKQVEVLQNMIKLLSEQLSKQPPPSTVLGDKLQTDVATLQGRSVQAARRDDEIAHAIDDINEHIDAQERYGPALPAPLKELFLPSGNNETVLSIYGALSVGYDRIIGNAATAANGAGRPPTPGGFYFGEFTPDFLIKLNDWIFLEAEIGIGADGSVSAGSFAQADFFVNDWLTIIAGRFVAPIGWYNERLNNPWVNKLPTDTPGAPPLLWLQVLPAFAMLGVQAEGAFYLGCSPFKLEYNAYISNGLNFTPSSPSAPLPSIDELANLEDMEGTFAPTITNEKAFGGRLGLWWPEMGLEAGISGMMNGDYVAGGFEDSLSLWALDFNYHKNNWDFRAEYGMTIQQAKSFVGTPGLTDSQIRRDGFYVQGAYRPRDAANKYLQNTEVVYRYSRVNFHGIDPTALDLTTYASPIDVPVRRQQNEFGVNYWFYPRLVLKAAYQINDEPGFHLHDNQFIAELDWGW
jgi:hypothetical protein